MLVQAVNIIPVVINGQVESFQTNKLYLDDGVETTKQITIIKIVVGLSQTKVDTIL